jgi:hypothetical protein
MVIPPDVIMLIIREHYHDSALLSFHVSGSKSTPLRLPKQETVWSVMSPTLIGVDAVRDLK